LVIWCSQEARRLKALKFPRNGGQGAENLRKKSRYVHECKNKTELQDLRC
jgi:hypothetical protein